MLYFIIFLNFKNFVDFTLFIESCDLIYANNFIN